MSPTAAALEVLPVPDQQHVLIPIQDITSSPTNPRTHFDPVYITDLATSVAAKGVLQAILVRPNPNSKGPRFEIVAGECRWRASVQAGRETIHAVIRELSDEDVLEFQLIENIHRKDLTDLEQAVGYRKLIDSNPDKHSAASIASRIGMSVEWVWDTLSLNNLIPEAKQLLNEQRIGRRHAVLVARQTPENQKRIIDPDAMALFQFEDAEALPLEPKKKPGKYDDVKPVSVRELEAWINAHIRFDVAHAAKAEPLKFEETAAKVQTAAEQPGRGKKVISITYDHRIDDDAKDDEGERTFGAQSWKRADGQQKSKTCEHSVLGVVVAGEGRGETFDVCVNRDKCKVHWKESVEAKEKAAKARASGNMKKAGKIEKKREESWQEKQQRERAAANAREAAWKAIAPAVIADAVEQVKAVKLLTPAMAVALARRRTSLDTQLLTKHLGKHWYKNLAAALLISEVGRYHYYAYGHNESGFAVYVRERAKPLGLDIKRLEAIRDKHAPAPATTGSADKRHNATKGGKK